MPATITAIINQKGGTGKTCTCACLGIGLSREGKNVLSVDFDPQSSLTISLGYDITENRGCYVMQHPLALFSFTASQQLHPRRAGTRAYARCPWRIKKPSQPFDHTFYNGMHFTAALLYQTTPHTAALPAQSRRTR